MTRPSHRRLSSLRRRGSAVVDSSGSGGGEIANQMRWDGESRGHYEVWYLTLNHRHSGLGVWIRYTLEAPEREHGEPYAQLWCAVFDRADPAANIAIHRRFPIGELSTDDRPFAVRIGDNELRNDGALGVLRGDGHELRWELSWRPASTVHHQMPSVMYRRGGLGETTVLSPNLSVPVEGSLVVDGRRYEFSGESLGQTHLWGRKHAHDWAWAHCTTFAGEQVAALECLTVRLKRMGRVLPPLTMLTLYLDGVEHRFNRLRQALSGRTTGTIASCSYTFSGRSGRLRLRGHFSCRPEDMIVAPYLDPDGAPSYCANTEVGDLELVVERREGSAWVEHATLRAEGTAHFEIGGRERDPRILGDHRPVDGEPG